jgi:hypothetical protein
VFSLPFLLSPAINGIHLLSRQKHHMEAFFKFFVLQQNCIQLKFLNACHQWFLQVSKHLGTCISVCLEISALAALSLSVFCLPAPVDLSLCIYLFLLVHLSLPLSQ